MNISRPIAMRSRSFRSDENRKQQVTQAKGERKTSFFKKLLEEKKNGPSKENICPVDKKLYHKVFHPEVKGIEREFQCVDQFDDILEYLHSTEAKFFIKEQYLDGRNITGKMRTILVDWIVQVHQRFNFLPETLALTVYVLDTYLDREVVEKANLQLVAITSLFVAAKYEEMYVPDVYEYEYVGDGQFTKADMFKMEQKLLGILSFRLYRPAPITFLRFFTIEMDFPEQVHKRAQYFIELCFQTYQLCHLQPSHMVVLSLALAASMDNCEINIGRMLKETGLCEEDLEKLRPILAAAVINNQENSKLKGIFKKYSESKFYAAAALSVEQKEWLRTNFKKQ